MDHAIILAAGKGERLVAGEGLPKPLKLLAGVPLIVRVMRELERAGIREISVITGYMSDMLTKGLAEYRFDATVRTLYNPHWATRPNGTSLLAAAHVVSGPTLLTMCDHLVSPALIRAVNEATAGLPDDSALGIDRDIARCFDLPDATKVQVEAGYITDIGKEITAYNAIDTGVFRITPALIDALTTRDRTGQGCSLSDGVRELAARNRMRAIDVGAATWIDVDTPEAFAFAERHITRYVVEGV